MYTLSLKVLAQMSHDDLEAVCDARTSSRRRRAATEEVYMDKGVMKEALSLGLDQYKQVYILCTYVSTCTYIHIQVHTYIGCEVWGSPGVLQVIMILPGIYPG